MRGRLSGVILVIVGLIEFMNIANNPRFASYRTVDVVGLLGCGACFGVALVALLGKLRRRSEAVQK
jgi:predicted metal-binding protein